MNKKQTLREAIESEPIVICPEVFDCSSAKAAEMCNFKAVLLSSAEFSCSRLGYPDMGFHSLDDLVHATYYISRSVDIPLVIDADDCFGNSLKTYNACERMVHAGADGILILDTDDNGRTLDLEEACTKFRAAKSAMKGSDCLLIARCDVDPYTDFDEACDRCNAYAEAGADLTLLVKISHDPDSDKLDLCRRIDERVKGWKMYPDLGAHNGKPDVNVDEIAKYNFRFVGIHYLLYAAFEGMLDYGHHIYEERSNVYFNKHNEPKAKFNSPAQFFGVENDKWLDKVREFDPHPEKSKIARLKHFLLHSISGLK